MTRPRIFIHTHMSLDGKIVGLNGSFIQAGLCDEVSIVLTPAADGTKGTQALFEADERYNRLLPTAFKLKQMQPLEDGSVWLRYAVEGPI